MRRNPSFLVATASMLIALTACQRKDPPAAATSGETPTAAAPASGPALPGVVPQAADATASGAAGPGAGTTAVGGMAASPQDAGAASGGAPMPSAGDGAASSPASAPR